MKQSFRFIAVISLMFVAFSSIAQNKNITATMKQQNLTTQQVSVIDKITIPANAIAAYNEKSLYIRNILRQQAGFLKYEIFQQEGESGDLTVITIATWKSQQHLDIAKSVIVEEMKKIKLNMPEFLEQQGIAMERSIYYPVEE